ncbi:histone deacetylase family protein [Roseomonas eburnea]|uniref:Histone deacetylase family protein n=1 Tax=Neoroseomonas eburnea TaxID=1346889 RepID=A0A9X9XHG4_9PROT|nr:histone deacetylase family protein [Neoroseomonas eburnea]MBR0683150.1 histone deacetylase family protein [Neoroseomonas eburnea]
MKTFAHPDQAGHTPTFFLQRGQVRRNFEVPGRAAALEAALHRLGLTPATPPALPPRAMEAVHTADYLAFLASAAADWAQLPEAGPEAVANIHPAPEMLAQGGFTGPSIIARTGWYTADTACPIGPGSWEAIQGAAACALAAAAEAAQGRTAYALCRPPGHHAYAARAGGHCYVNNAALAAQALRDAGAARVAVIDIDSHHGNGTQGIFWERGDVLTISIHGDPDRYYPWYVGRTAERGAGAGDGRNMNMPLAFGTADEGWLDAIRHGLAAIRDFKAEALVVALGFDASKDEPLASLAVTEDGFAKAAAMIGGLGLPAAITQEGGYNVDVIGTLLERFMTGWSGA